MYAKKSTAIRHLQQGEPFTNKTFQKFWSDREVCTAALTNRPEFFWFVVSLNPAIEWDEDFMATLFGQLLDKGNTLRHLSSLGRFLPPSITESKEIALKAAHIASGDLKHYLSPDLLLDPEIRMAYWPLFDQDARQLNSKTVALLTDRSDLLIELVTACPALYWSLPEHLRQKREASMAICAQTASFRYAYGGLDDDEAFVLDVLERTHELETTQAFDNASYRLRKIVRGSCPFEYLRKVVAVQKLDSELDLKDESAKQKSGVFKV